MATELNNETNTNTPSHLVYRVDGEGQQAKWTKVGVLFPANKGYTQILTGIEKDLRFVIQEVKEPEA